MPEQLALPVAQSPPFALADLDEWIAELTADSRGRSDRFVGDSYASYFPSEWARGGLGAILGRDIPYGRWSYADLLRELQRARRVLQGGAADA